MRRRCCVGVILLALGILSVPLYGQDAGGGAPAGDRERGFRLEQNYPNPFNPSTRIPFVLEDVVFQDGRPAIVSIRIFNILQQLVAVPTALNHPLGNGVPVLELAYETPGRKEAFWDGRDRNGREVASGVYYVQLVVNNESVVRKMVVAK
ncbi:MAG TPA: hypothetical protein VF158_17430 [Longimicrobiales bacterium]